MKKRLTRIVFYIAGSVIGLLLLLFILLQLPAVQTYIAQKAANYVSEMAGTRITIERLGVTMLNRVEVKGLYVEDQMQDTLVHAGRLKVGIDLLGLLNNQLTIHKIDLRSGTVKLQRREGDTTFNYQHVIDAFASGEEPSRDTSSESFQINVGKIDLSGIHFLFRDKLQGQSIDVLLTKANLTPIRMDITNHDYRIAGLSLNGADVRYNAFAPDSNLLATMAPDPPIQDTSSLNIDVLAHTITIQNSSFHYNNHTQPIQPRGMDYDHLHFTKLHTELEDVSYQGGVHVSGAINELAVKEQQSGLAIDQFAARLNMDDDHIDVKDFALVTPNSSLRNKTSVQFTSWGDFANAMDKVKLDTRFRNSKVALTDIAPFVPAIYDTEIYQRSPGYTATLDGKVHGTLNDLQTDRFKIESKGGTRLLMKGNVKDMADLDSMKLDVRLEELFTTSDDLQTILADFGLPEPFERIDTLTVQGTYQGGLTNFQTDLALRSSAGDILADVNMTLPDTNTTGAYSGEVEIQQFEAGRVLGVEDLGRVSLNINGDGSGYTLKTADAQVDAVIKDCRYMAYDYDSITIDGQFNQKVFTGSVRSQDEHLQFAYDGTINFKDSIPDGDFHVDLRNMDLHALNLSSDKLRVATAVDAEFTGTSIDDLTGKMVAKGTEIARNDTLYKVDTLNVQSSLTDSFRAVSIQSDPFNASVKGGFVPSTLPSSLTNFSYNFVNTNAYEKHTGNHHELELQAEVKDADARIWQLIDPAIQKVGHLSLDGIYNSRTNELDLEGDLPKVVYNGMSFQQIDVDVHTLNDQLHYAMSVGQASLSEQLVVPSVHLHGTLAGDSMRVGARLVEPYDSSNYRLAIGGNINRKHDRITFKIQSPLVLNNKVWEVDPMNSIVLADSGIFIHHVALNSGNAKLGIQTKHAVNSANPLSISMKNFDLRSISSLINLKGYEFAGMMNGELRILTKDEQSYLTTDLSCNNVQVNQDTLGNIHARIQQHKKEEHTLSIDAGMKGPKGQIITKGSYDYQESTTHLDLMLKELKASALSPYLRGVVSGLSGNMKGNASIKGPISEPSINGVLTFNQVRATVDYLGTDYVLANETVQFTNQQVAFPDFRIADTKGNDAIITGDITHDGFTDVGLNLDVSLNQFPVADASPQANKYFYGKGRVSGKARIRGTASSPDINLQIGTKPVTDMYFPIAYQTDVVREDLYRFVQQGKKDSIAEKRQFTMNNGGLTLNAQLDIRDDARFTIIMDPKAEDNLSFQGQGNVTFNMKPDGSYKAVGTYNLTSGSYLFTFQDVIKREFDLQEGSTLHFSGDPMDARFDITATYSTKTSTYPLVSNYGDDFSNNQMERVSQQKVKVNVLMHLEGTIENPDITFEIEVPEIEKGGTVSNTIANRIGQINQNETERNKQVFALILFNRFISDENALAGGSGSPTSTIYEKTNKTVSHFFTKQLNKIAGKHLKGFEMDVDLESKAKAGQKINYLEDTDVKLQASQKLFNERMTVKVGGDIGMSNSGKGSSDRVTGDFIVEYKVNKKGNLKVKAFRVSDYDLFEDESNYKNGLGLKFERGFDKLGELFQKKNTEQDTVTQKGE